MYARGYELERPCACTLTPALYRHSQGYCLGGKNVWWPFKDLKEPIAYFPFDESTDNTFSKYTLSLSAGLLFLCVLCFAFLPFQIQYLAGTTTYATGRMDKALVFSGANFYSLNIPDIIWQGSWSVVCRGYMPLGLSLSCVPHAHLLIPLRIGWVVCD
jgi:hypothetical protein